jgi:hypothetical protein
VQQARHSGRRAETFGRADRVQPEAGPEQDRSREFWAAQALRRSNQTSSLSLSRDSIGQFIVELGDEG